MFGFGASLITVMLTKEAAGAILTVCKILLRQGDTVWGLAAIKN